MAGFWDWYSNAVAQGDGLNAVPQPSPYAPQNVPMPPARPDAARAMPMPPANPVTMPSGLPYDPPVYSAQTVPQPPARPDSGLYPSRAVPTPPARPAGLTPPARTAGLYGDPSVTMPSGLPYDPPSDPTQPMRPIPLPPRRPANLMAQTPAARAPQAPQARQADLPAPGAVPTSLTPATPSPASAGAAQRTEWVQDIDPITRQTYWTQKEVNNPQAPASTASALTVFGRNPSEGVLNGAGSGLEAFLGRLTGQNGSPASVGANGPQIPNPTGLATALSAQPSMQAQNSTGPTAFLDNLFGFRG